jgi:nucleoside-diphosphate-sugar epimerase
MRVTVIGATGHISTYLVPRLVRAGHDVVSVSRGQRDLYQSDGAWDRVESVEVDREAAEERGEFGAAILETDPDVVVDLICFEPESAESLVESLRGEVQHLLHCGTVWVHGPSDVIPTTEDEPRTRRPLGEYGRKKAAIEASVHLPGGDPRGGRGARRRGPDRDRVSLHCRTTVVFPVPTEV